MYSERTDGLLIAPSPEREPEPDPMQPMLLVEETREAVKQQETETHPNDSNNKYWRG